jgi:hypothetical protein
MRFCDGGRSIILLDTKMHPAGSTINIKTGDDMNATDRKATDSDRTAQDAATRYLYGTDVIDGAERVCCAASVAFSIMCGAVFSAFSEWF